jgi:1-acyl-sn-glycerol-3-phosphate acyltransferase
MFFRLLLAPVYFIYKLWIGFVFWISLMFLYPAFYFLLQSKKKFPKAFKLKCFWAKLLQVMLFCPIRREYRSELPRSPYIIVSNHSSHLDTVFMYRVFDDYFLFIGKGELLKWPLFSLFFRTMDIPVDRENNKKAYTSLQKAYDALERGECIAMYPEGTIPGSSPRMKAFKNGAFRMAIDKQLPIVPVTWQTNYHVLNNPEKLFSPSLPSVVRVVVHPPVYPPKHADDADLIALRNQVFRTIDSALPAGAPKENASV